MNSIQRLEKVQELLGLNRRELGIYIGVPQNTVYSWLSPARARECPEAIAELAERLATYDKIKLENG